MSPTIDAQALALLPEWDLSLTHRDLDVPLERLIQRIGEPALLAIILHLEQALPEPFPEALLEQVGTLRDLLGFHETKRSRLPMRGDSA
jgi:hypothetical protein